ncbi:AsnC family transcriptional regulator [Arthrobacter alpinus]|uniref:Lrp/AsnC family transcriptional regulator n=1 Tax=Arthrobacter alpinus TaxID=656366 RepID=UPI0005C836E7|nr:Lrp/AsnC family transcriptional regulator [Arthrobacter alpinus]ALV45074.1 AsnC family transcriptional regulator [Arthrobacter alpinus]
MDATDSAILNILAREARISFSDLGRRIGLSTNAASARVRRLEDDGVILGYQAILADSIAGTGPNLEVFIDIRLKPEADSGAFLAWAMAAPAVRDAVHVTGPYDYILHAVVPNTRALDQLLRRLKTEGGAAQTQSRLALR